VRQETNKERRLREPVPVLAGLLNLARLAVPNIFLAANHG